MTDDSCNCLKVRSASLAITKLYDRYLEPSGLRVGQYYILKQINWLAPVCVSDLAQQCRLDRTTLVRNLKPLEEKNFVLDISEEGTRNRRLVLTDCGLEKLKDAEIYWKQAQDYVKQELGEADLNMLTDILIKVKKL
jgi:DNA-binding MarR family transcriptional regulator